MSVRLRVRRTEATPGLSPSRYAPISRQRYHYRARRVDATRRAQALSLRRRSLLDHLGQLPRLVHLDEQVAPAHKLALDVTLRDGGPVRVRFDAVANSIVCEDVKRLVLDVVRVENLHRRVRESALREELRALHEEKYFVALHHRLDPILSRLHEPRRRRDARARSSRRWPRECRRQQRLRGGEEEEGGTKEGHIHHTMYYVHGTRATVSP
mmetsp:Transcript_11606/g.38747  ORF Transcript_11606/g.38747 Transcript_11606/m.38747 type:complete len:211 (+) Transcript_11606:107-739(+)